MTAMDRAGNGDDISSDVRERWLFNFKLSGDLRFISHRDTMRLFQRALARTALPVRFTEGFNPHPRLTLPFPRPVGIESDAEVIVIDFEESIDGDESRAALHAAMPKGIELVDARRLAPRERVHPVGVRYRLDVSDRPSIDIEAAVKSILDADSIEIKRTNVKDGSSHSVDARAFIVDMNLTGDTVEFELRVVNGGGVKPAEIAALIGYDAAAVNHRIKRMEIHWTPQPLKKVLNP